MNISIVINDIKTLLGLQTIALPFDQPVEVVIKNILEGSIRTFSHYHKAEKECYELRKNLRYASEAEKNVGIYFIPEQLTVTPVQDVYAYPASGEYQQHEVNSSAFTVGSPFVGFGAYGPQDILNATVTGAAINKYAGLTSKQPTSQWLGYNKIRLYDFPENSMIRFVAKCDHDLAGESIEESCIEAFKKLAMLDVKMTLYNNIKNMVNLGSAFKDIQLKIEDWSNAASERDQLLDNWNGVMHLDDIEDNCVFF